LEELPGKEMSRDEMEQISGKEMGRGSNGSGKKCRRGRNVVGEEMAWEELTPIHFSAQQFFLYDYFFDERICKNVS
jgi:hypothetical protein